VTSLVATLTIDCRDPGSVAAFWCAVLGYELDSLDAEDAWIIDPARRGWALLFQTVPEGKTVKNRLHLDLTPGPDGRDADIERILALGARRVDIGQTGAESWTVLADPEGNEFCVIRAKRTLIA